MDVSFDDAKAKAQQASSNLRDNDAGVPDESRIDYTDYDVPTVSLEPEVLVTFEEIVDFTINFNEDEPLSARRNLRDGGYNNYGNTVVVTVRGPEVVRGETWAHTDEDDWTDLEIIGDPEADRNPYEVTESVVRDDDGEVTGAETDGVDLGQSTFDGEPSDGIGAEFIQIEFERRRAEDVLGLLDTAGQWSHDNESGDYVGGILEAPPEMSTDDYDAEQHGAPRAIGYPELRADMVGQPGAFLYEFDADDEAEIDSRTAKSISAFRIEEAEGETDLVPLTALTPEDDAYALPEYPRQGNLFWDHDGSGAVADANADAEPETDEGVADAKAMMSEDADGDDTLSYEDLSDDEQTFVEEAAEVADAQDLDTIRHLDDADTETDHDDFAERVAVSEEVRDDTDADDLADIIDAYAEG